MDYGDFFVTGDEWGLVEVVPVENREHYTEVAREYAEHHKDTEFSAAGWTTRPFILHGPAVALSVRALSPDAITEAFSRLLLPTERVTTCEDFTGPPFPLTGCVAWKVPSEKAIAAGFYGRVTDGILTSLWWSPHPFDEPAPGAIADALSHFGARHQLLLAVGGEGAIDLNDRETLTKYLSYYHDE